MDAKQNGNSQAGATPTVVYDWGGLPREHACPGLTKREEFAARAMQGLLANPQPVKRLEGHSYPESVAVEACDCADALLAKLAQSSEE